LSIVNYWLKSTKKIFTEPTSFFENVGERQNFNFAISFAAISGAIGALLSSVVASTGLFGEPLALSLVLLSPLIGLVGGVLGLLVNAVFVHLIVYSFGERGFTRTTEALTYATPANAILGWIPVIGPLLALFAILFIEVKALKKFHSLSTGKAVIAALFPVIIGLILIAIGLIVFLGSITALTG